MASRFPNTEPGFGVYVHWPFCLSKCPYCDFNSHVRDRVDQAAFAAPLRQELAREAARAAGIEAEFVKVTDMQAIMAYDLLSTPGLVINEKLVSSGRIPTVAEVKGWLVQP